MTLIKAVVVKKTSTKHNYLSNHNYLKNEHLKIFIADDGGFLNFGT